MDFPIFLSTALSTFADHPALLEAAGAQQLACIYCLDDESLQPQLSEEGSAARGLPRLGPHRCRQAFPEVPSRPSSG